MREVFETLGGFLLIYLIMAVTMLVIEPARFGAWLHSVVSALKVGFQ